MSSKPTDDSRTGGSFATESSELLDAGLRAAFRATPAEHASCVVATMERTLGVKSVLLREPDDEPAPLVNPRSSEAPPPGRAVGRYQISGEIARGGVGVILRGRDVDLGRDVAMKVLLAAHAGRPGMVQRFMEEAQITGQLQHPGILPVYELGLDVEHRPFFTMKLVKGRTLAALLANREHPSHERRRFLSIFEHVCQTMAYAHSRGVVHRDLKPSNIMVGAFGEVQVLDWGLAKVLGTGAATEDAAGTMAPDAAVASQIETIRSGDSSAQSVAGSLMGTPAYMPPEQARGEVDRLDERCDVFALGAMLCEILTGRPPYSGSRSDVIRQAAECRIDDARQRLSTCGADDDLIGLAVSCLSPAPAARPRTAAAVAAAVNAHLAELEERARSLEVAAAEARAKAREERRARRLTTVLAAAILLAIVLAGGGWLRARDERQKRAADADRVAQAAIGSAQAALGRALASPIVDRAAWDAAESTGGHLRGLLTNAQLDPAVRAEADAVIASLQQAARDRRMLETIESVVIAGASHPDAQSWRWMDEQLLAAYREYGIDLLAMPREEIVRRVRESDLGIELTNGIELWIGTCGSLGMQFGDTRYTEAFLRERLEIVYAADPDPYRVQLRRMIYSGKPPDAAALRALAESRPFEDVPPVTLSWLGTAFAMSGDMAGCDDVYRRALLCHPDDTLLNHDYAWCLANQQRWQEAIRQYERCLVLRPQTGGIWRSMGRALREAGDLAGARRAFEQSLVHQPAHAATHVDLGITLLRQDQPEAAATSFAEAIRLLPSSAAARAWRGRALHLQQRFDEAMSEYAAAADGIRNDPTWQEPIDAWMEACGRRVIDVAGESADDETP